MLCLKKILKETRKFFQKTLPGFIRYIAGLALFGHTFLPAYTPITINQVNAVAHYWYRPGGAASGSGKNCLEFPAGTDKREKAGMGTIKA
jgi:hypothetical protein